MGTSPEGSFEFEMQRFMQVASLMTQSSYYLYNVASSTALLLSYICCVPCGCYVIVSVLSEVCLLAPSWSPGHQTNTCIHSVWSITSFASSANVRPLCMHIKLLNKAADTHLFMLSLPTYISSDAHLYCLLLAADDDLHSFFLSQPPASTPSPLQWWESLPIPASPPCVSVREIQL